MNVGVSKERDYGIDLLRLVLMFMVCVLHTIGQGGIIRTCEAGSLQFYVFWFIEILSYCAVDGFAIISGYMAKDKPRKCEKLAEMWFQVFFYSFIVTLVLTLFGFNKGWGLKDIIKCLFPMIFGKYWYFTGYFLLFLITPLLNKFIFAIDEASAKKMLIMIVFLFSFGGVLAEPFVTQAGYSALWIIVLYCLGAIAKRAKLFETKKSWILIIIWTCCILVTWGICVFLNSSRLVNYVSPTILLSGMIMVILFSRIKLKGTIVSRLSPMAFGIYLLQLNQVIWNEIINGRFAFIASKNICLGLLFLFACAGLIFIAGLIVEFLRSKAAKLLRIPSLCKGIVRLIDWGLTKFSISLK